MPQTALGNLGINFEHTLGTDDWKNSYDANWVITDWSLQPFIINRTTTAEPGAPARGDAYILGSSRTGTDWGSDSGSVNNAIAIYANIPGLPDNSAWIYLTPREGFRVYDRTANQWLMWNGTAWVGMIPVEIIVPIGTPTSAVAAATNVAYFRAPKAFTLQEVRASVFTVSSSGLVTVDINEGGTTLLSTKLTIDANEKTSVTAATPPVISDSAIADDAEITIDVDTAGTGAQGLVVIMKGLALV